MRRFTSDASHQMRTPLAVLRAHIGVLRHHGTGTPEGRASLDDIDTAADRLRRLIAQLIALARAEEGAAGASSLQPIDLGRTVAECARQLAPAALAAESAASASAPSGRARKSESTPRCVTAQR
jgi:two-component system sensor histidine kinase TctE